MYDAIGDMSRGLDPGEAWGSPADGEDDELPAIDLIRKIPPRSVTSLSIFCTVLVDVEE